MGQTKSTVGGQRADGEFTFTSVPTVELQCIGRRTQPQTCWALQWAASQTRSFLRHHFPSGRRVYIPGWGCRPASSVFSKEWATQRVRPWLCPLQPEGDTLMLGIDPTDWLPSPASPGLVASTSCTTPKDSRHVDGSDLIPTPD